MVLHPSQATEDGSGHRCTNDAPGVVRSPVLTGMPGNPLRLARDVESGARDHDGDHGMAHSHTPTPYLVPLNRASPKAVPAAVNRAVSRTALPVAVRHPKSRHRTSSRRSSISLVRLAPVLL